MTILKRTGLVLLALITLLAIWIGVNSIDDAELSPLAKEMLKPFPEVPPEENGYELIRYMSDENFEPPYGDEWEKVLGNLRGKEWDPEFVKTITEKNQVAIADLTKATLKPRFKFPVANKAMDLPPYQNYIRVVRLLLLQAKLDVHESDLASALQKITTAVSFCQKIMTEENHYIVSYALGTSCLSDALGITHEISSNRDIEIKSWPAINKNIFAIKPYADDGFDLVFRGEAMFLMRISEDMNSTSFVERMESAKSFVLESNFGFYDKARVTLTELFPAYYFPINNSTSKYSVIYKEASESTGKYCKVNPVIPNGPKESIAPENQEGAVNIIPGRWREPGWFFSGFFERRCLAHTYFDAIRTIIAIHTYQQDHHSLPLQLSDLVPVYIDRLPVDYFDGEPLRYSRKDKWLYSVGTDYNDDGGSPEGYTRDRCDKSNHTCNTNPTFPINWNDYPVELR